MGCKSEGAWPGQCLRWGCREAQDDGRVHLRNCQVPGWSVLGGHPWAWVQPVCPQPGRQVQVTQGLSAGRSLNACSVLEL